MSKAKINAQEIISLIEKGESISSVKTILDLNYDKWYRYSASAYEMYFQTKRKERDEDQLRKNVGSTANKDIDDILNINDKLSDYAWLLPVFSTMGHLYEFRTLVQNLPLSEGRIIDEIGKMTMHPNKSFTKKREI